MRWGDEGGEGCWKSLLRCGEGVEFRERRLVRGMREGVGMREVGRGGRFDEKGFGKGREV